MKKLVIPSLICFILMTGCAEDGAIEVYVDYNDEEKKLQMEQILKDTEEVYTGTAIFIDDELLVAIQVNPWIGFKEQKIEKRLQKQLEEQYPDYDVLVSTDYKLYWESSQLLDENEDEEKVSEKVKKLKKLSREET